DAYDRVELCFAQIQNTIIDLNKNVNRHFQWCKYRGHDVAELGRFPPIDKPRYDELLPRDFGHNLHISARYGQQVDVALTEQIVDRYWSLPESRSGKRQRFASK